MGDIGLKIRNLMASPNFFERICSLSEIRLNQFLFSRKLTIPNIQTFEEFMMSVSSVNQELSSLLKPDSEADKSYREVRTYILNMNEENRLPFPMVYNADITLGILCYALTRSLKPNMIVETGVGYGITSSLILLALEKNHSGRLISIDLHPLSDTQGKFVGIAIPEYLRHRWSMRSGGSRRHLKNIIADEKKIGLFVHDSANVYTLQKWEFATMWPKLWTGGVAVFNNINETFIQYLQSIPDAQVLTHRQIEKASCATAFILKRSESGKP